MTGKTILFVLTEQQFYRNYITSGALSLIQDRCVFLVHPDLAKNEFPGIERSRIIPYSYPSQKTIFHQHIFNINMRLYRDRSKTFVFRLSRLRRRWQLIYKFLALPIIHSLVKFFLYVRTHDEALSAILTQVQPSLILVPSTGYEGIAFELIYQAKRHHIPSCLLIDNWDNLSSKTIFTVQPDYMTVWGEQSLEHARDIHHIPKEKVYPLGTPRFREYLNRDPAKLSSPYPFPYAVFAGNAIPFDELTTLRKLDALLEAAKSPLTIIYRPHPWRQTRKGADTFFEYDFKHVKLDLPAREYYKREFRERFAPELDYYPRLLHNMEFMICPLSTMLIEGLLFDKRVYVLTYDDGIHPTSPKFAFQYYKHFEGIEHLPNVIIIDRIEDLTVTLNDDPNPFCVEKNKSLNYYISETTKNYPQHLKEIVEKLIASN